MYELTLTEEQRTNIVNELAKLVETVKKIDSIECIYFGVYNFREREELELPKLYNMSVTIIKNKNIESSEDLSIDELNKTYMSNESLDSFGLRINLSFDYNTRYSNNLESYSTFKLFNGNIIYDKNGEYTKIKELAQEEFDNGKTKTLCYADNLVKVNPPLV